MRFVKATISEVGAGVPDHRTGVGGVCNGAASLPPVIADVGLAVDVGRAVCTGTQARAGHAAIS